MLRLVSMEIARIDMGVCKNCGKTTYLTHWHSCEMKPKEWQGLTKEDIDECESKSEWIIDNHIDHEDFAKHIEQKLKEKNT